MCLRPLWARIFFRRSRSSRSLLSKTLAMTWLVLPSLMSLCLLRNQSGILYWRGFCIMVMSFSVSSSVSSPALLERGMSAFFSTILAYLRPIPLMEVSANMTLVFPHTHTRDKRGGALESNPHSVNATRKSTTSTGITVVTLTVKTPLRQATEQSPCDLSLTLAVQNH